MHADWTAIWGVVTLITGCDRSQGLIWGASRWKSTSFETDMDWVDFEYACIKCHQQNRRLTSLAYTWELSSGRRQFQDSLAYQSCLETLLPFVACTTHSLDLSTLESDNRSQHLSSWKDCPTRGFPLDSQVKTKNKRVRQFFLFLGSQ